MAQLKNLLVNGPSKFIGPVAGATFSKPIYFHANALPKETDLQFVLGIDSFSNDGGQVGWKEIDQLIVKEAGYAATAGTASTASNVAWGNVSGKPETFTPATHTHDYSPSNHNHDTIYSKLDHSHSEYAVTGHSHSDYNPILTSVSGTAPLTLTLSNDKKTITGSISTGTTNKVGVVKQHTSVDCTSYTSDEGATTPAAVKKAVGLFGDQWYSKLDHNHDGSYAPTGHSHNYLPLTGGTLTGNLTVGKTVTSQTSVTGGIAVHDLRSSTPKDGMFGDKIVNFYFDDTGPSNAWQSILHMQGWTAGSYAAWELGGNAHTSRTAPGTLRYRVFRDSQTDGWHTILMSKPDGKMAQKLYFDETSLSQDTTSTTGLDYIVGIKQFAAPGNGELMWQSAGSVKVGAASNADYAGSANSANYATTAGRLNHPGISSSWYNGRDNALVTQTGTNGYSPIMSMKTTNGSWEVGHYNSGGYYNDFLINYKDDTEYNNATPNTVVHAVKIKKEGNIILNGNNIALQSGAGQINYNSTTKSIDFIFA